MAILIPSLEVAKGAKQKPTEGEIYLLEFLATNFDDEVEVYFQPCFNGDRPDIVLMSQKFGLIIIEVKDWNLDRYSIDANNKWSVRGIAQRIKSPFQQIYAYKKNFFEIHVNGLLEKSLKSPTFFKTIKTYVYFHHSTKREIGNLYTPHLQRLNEQARHNEDDFKSKKIDFGSYDKTREWIERGKYKFERDMSFSLCNEKLDKISFPFTTTKESIFDESIYNEFKRLLNPPYHYASEGRSPNYSDKQGKLIKSASQARSKICGLAGSGKTVVLAGRAVNAHKRHGGRVLILTFNITLCSYIHDKISAVREDFPWSSFDINNYHRFITIALNNSGIEIEIPEELHYGEDAGAARKLAERRDQFLEEKYYSNLKIFEREEVQNKYDTILIDEIQDYKPEWIKIIRSFFLEKAGEMLIFGDEKQNIYKRALDGDRRSKVVEGFGEWIKLTKSYRYKEQSPIIPLVDAFQKSFLLQDYELDADDSFQLSLASVGVHACDSFERKNLNDLAKKIIEIAKENKVHPNDISIISSQEIVLRELDHVLRTSETHKERTLCAFPSLEVTRHPKYSKKYQEISTSKKKGFNLNSGVMKLSSTHSFKGFESPFIFLLVNNKDSPEMVFTGLTRAKENLVVYLEADSPYLEFFSKHLHTLDSNLVHY